MEVKDIYAENVSGDMPISLHIILYNETHWFLSGIQCYKNTLQIVFYDSL